MEYGHKGNYFFVQMEIDETEKKFEREVYSNTQTG
jgi:hypothetical protein